MMGQFRKYTNLAVFQCDEKLPTIERLCVHMASEHGMPTDVQEAEFENEDEFQRDDPWYAAHPALTKLQQFERAVEALKHAKKKS